jgi:hypothetical protein
VIALGLLAALIVLVPFLLDIILAYRWQGQVLERGPDRLTRVELRELIRVAPSGISGLVRATMALTAVATLALAVIYVLVKNPSNPSRLVDTLITTLGTLVAAITAFYFATRAAQTKAAATSAAGVPVNVQPPTISGDGNLKASTGTWSGNPTSYSYKWEGESKASPGVFEAVPDAQDSATYQPVADDAPRRIRVTVVATNAQGASQPASSEPYGPITH